MRLLPTGNILHAQQVVRIAFGLAGDVDKHQRPDKAVGRNLVNGPASFGEMRGSIDVSSEVFGEGNVTREVSVLLNSPKLARLERRLGRTRPVGRIGADGMGEIDGAGKHRLRQQRHTALREQEQRHCQADRNTKSLEFHVETTTLGVFDDTTANWFHRI